MKNLLYIIAVFISLSACTSRQAPKPYNWDDDLHQRLLADFCLTESQVKDYIRKYIPDVTDEQMRQWEESKALECRMIDGGETLFPQCRSQPVPDRLCLLCRQNGERRHFTEHERTSQ